MSHRNTDPNEEKPKHQWQMVKEGWYDKLGEKVNLTVKGLDTVIIVCTIALILTFVIGYLGRGYTVQFDSLGGTPVESQKLMYGDLIVVDEPPTREGYRFAGWYKDILFEYPWNLETDTVEQSMTLYASWEKIE